MALDSPKDLPIPSVLGLEGCVEEGEMSKEVNVVVLGSAGVGKTSLANYLFNLGDRKASLFLQGGIGFRFCFFFVFFLFFICFLFVFYFAFSFSFFLFFSFLLFFLSLCQYFSFPPLPSPLTLPQKSKSTIKIIHSRR